MVHVCCGRSGSNESPSPSSGWTADGEESGLEQMNGTEAGGVQEITLRNALTVGADGHGRRADVHVSDGRIADINPAAEKVAGDGVDCTHRAVIPGLVNAHYHSNGNFDRGRWDNLPLESFGLYAFPRMLVPTLSEREIYVRTAIGAMELVRSGATCVVDFLADPSGFTEESLGAVVSAYRDVGLRVVIALSVFDLPYYETVLADHDWYDRDVWEVMERSRPPAWEQWEPAIRRAVERFHRPDKGISIGLAPSAPERCSDELLVGCASLAAELDLVIHTHALETRTQAVLAQQRYGRTLLAQLEDLGFLSERVSLHHGIWMSDEDMSAVARSGATVVHNPLSNLKLGSGLCAVPELRKRGITLALGTDAASCNDGNSMFETLKVAALLHKIWDLDVEDWVGAREVWWMATLGGARAAGMSEEIGDVQVGRCADLVLLDLRSSALTPLSDPVRQAVLAPSADMVDAVLINGRWVLKDGRFVGVDEDALKDEARSMGADIASRSTQTADLADRMVGTVNRAWQESRRLYNGPHRLMVPSV